MKGQYAPVPKTGQTTFYRAGDDGDLHKGVTWPTPRFTDNNNGTVTDNLTGLIWTKNANAFGQRTWDQALIDANNLQDGVADLADGSQAGEWRLPNVRELQSLVDYGRWAPALPAEHPFLSVQSSKYWSSTTYAYTFQNSFAWFVQFYDGYVASNHKDGVFYVWCVRGGR